MAKQRFPFIRPQPPALSTLGPELAEIEASGIYSNYGPVNARFEAALQELYFDDGGACVTVNNATTGLLLAVRHEMELGRWPRRPAARYALMPAFTFAATAHAALWNGLTPLLCDIDPRTWLPDAGAEEELLARHGDDVAVIIPYATFGNSLDLDRYRRLAERHGVPVVVDAAPSLGSQVDGRQFGADSALPVVYSLHATKSFATGEAGVIHSADRATVERLRAMGNFGFAAPRTASLPGLNAKLSEVGALLALKKLADFPAITARRAELAASYRAALPEATVQSMVGNRHAHQFMPVLLPRGVDRTRIAQLLAERGVGTGQYFSPHLGEHPYFIDRAVAGDLTVTADVAQRILALPLYESMADADVAEICAALHDCMAVAT